MASSSARDLRDHTAEVLRRVEACEEELVRSGQRRTWIPALEVVRELQRLGPDTTGLADDLRGTLADEVIKL
ncbi:type II toxin-antitoxin system Phd/YefM family antitoxin [Tenggerimyces flavus]|uniref:Type II toxin-antitoxin system Phd/YefM family antitoxin n=1 Tax=Tenggerimyces flavus TaxID=1708749 RepID=A0ABV7YBS2_9ACTN|nr:type II toxin-antitoxin system Phd/YefM family antitoxin [Tenggerimyces flavus]MBM7789080.1 antitoxin (DNA-binding transcriptional repressor) of toxin-antitoxin stability system [Tenggerimyces flavus]